MNKWGKKFLERINHKVDKSYYNIKFRVITSWKKAINYDQPQSYSQKHR